MEPVGQGNRTRARDDVTGNILQVLHDSADGIAMSCDENKASCFEVRHYGSLPERHDWPDDRLQAFDLGDLLLRKRLVLGLQTRMVLAVCLDLRRRQVEAVAPDLHQLGACFLSR